MLRTSYSAALVSLLLAGYALADPLGGRAVTSERVPGQSSAAAVNAPSEPAKDPQALALALSQSVIGKTVGDYTLVDRYDRKVALSAYRGKPLLVSFIYTGCTQVCSTTTKYLAKAVKAAQDALGPSNFSVLTIGFNAPFDTPQAMRVFAARQGIDASNWEFLSGDVASVDRLTKDLGFSAYATGGGFDHITQVTVVDAAGKIYRQVYGDDFDLPLLVEPLKELVTGAPVRNQGAAGLMERVRLFCTVYDPASGSYRLNYALFIEIFSGLTIVGGTLYFLLGEWRRNRKTRAVRFPKHA